MFKFVFPGFSQGIPLPSPKEMLFQESFPRVYQRPEYPGGTHELVHALPITPNRHTIPHRRTDPQDQPTVLSQPQGKSRSNFRVATVFLYFYSQVQLQSCYHLFCILRPRPFPENVGNMYIRPNQLVSVSFVHPGIPIQNVLRTWKCSRKDTHFSVQQTHGFPYTQLQCYAQLATAQATRLATIPPPFRPG
jgi:hypothetical protein